MKHETVRTRAFPMALTDPAFPPVSLIEVNVG